MSGSGHYRGMTRVALLHLAVVTLTLACDAVEDPIEEPDDIDVAHDGQGLASELDAAAVPVAVINPGFEIPWAVPVGEPATTLAVCASWPGAAGASASHSWHTYANTAGTSINSWIVDAPYYPAAGPLPPSNLVSVGGGQDGLVQVLGPQCVATDVNAVSAWVYTVVGRAQLQIGNGGAGGGTTVSTTTVGKWEQLFACGRPDMWNNEIVVYGEGPAVYYVDDVEVKFSDACPVCPHSWLDEGVALDPKCGTCVDLVCADRPECCTDAWDESCVDAGRAICTFDCAPEED